MTQSHKQCQSAARQYIKPSIPTISPTWDGLRKEWEMQDYELMAKEIHPYAFTDFRHRNEVNLWEQECEPDHLKNNLSRWGIHPQAARQLWHAIFRFAVMRGGSLKIWYLGEMVRMPSINPNDQTETRHFNVVEKWERFINVWYLRLVIERPCDEEHIAVIAKVAGGPSRAILMEVDDFLHKRGGALSISQLRGIVDGEVQRINEELNQP